MFRPPWLTQALLGAALVLGLAAGCMAPQPSAVTPVTEAPAAAAARSSGAGIAARPARADSALTIARDLTAIGPRVAGQPGERLAAEYLRDAFTRAGYGAEIQEFTFRRFDDRGSSLDTAGRRFSGVALEGSPPGRVEGRLVLAGIGRPDEFPPESRGAIALVERGTLTFREKAANAAAAGAVGVVVFNNQPGGFAGSLGSGAPLPVLGLMRDEGLELRTTAGSVVRLDIDTVSEAVTSYNVVADSDPSKAQTVVVGGHFDSVAGTAGANDNASGTAAVVEIAQRLRGADYPFNIRYIAFGAEESGLLGSRAYLERPDVDGRRIKAMINLDMVGVGRALFLGGDQGLIDRARAAAPTGIDTRVMGAGGGSDHASFAARGIPAIFVHVANARPGDDPNYHAPGDRVELLDPVMLQAALDITIGLLNRL